MELSEEERQNLLDFLESEDYEDFGGFHISKRKIDAVKTGRYKDEVKACEVLVKQGFDVYLLDENYTRKRQGRHFFQEKWHT